MVKTLLSSDSTFLSVESVSSLLGLITLVLYHYFYSKNNINFLTNDVKLLKKGLEELSDSVYNVVDNKINTMDEHYNTKLSNITSHIDEIKSEDSKYRDDIKKDTDSRKEAMYGKIDILRSEIVRLDNEVTKLRANVDVLLHSDNNDYKELIHNNVNMIIEKITFLKEYNQERYNFVTKCIEIQKGDINTMNEKIFMLVKETHEH